MLTFLYRIGPRILSNQPHTHIFKAPDHSPPSFTDLWTAERELNLTCAHVSNIQIREAEIYDPTICPI